MTDEVRELCDLLRDVPEDLIIGLIDSKDIFKPLHTQVNIGDGAHKAADLIERLAAENERKDAHIAQLELAIASWKREENEWEQERDQQEQENERKDERIAGLEGELHGYYRMAGSGVWIETKKYSCQIAERDQQAQVIARLREALALVRSDLVKYIGYKPANSRLTVRHLLDTVEEALRATAVEQKPA